MSSSLTVQELLREASASSGQNTSVPLDEQVKRFRKSFWEHDHESSSEIVPIFRRTRPKWAPRLDTMLGIGGLVALMLIVAGILVHSFGVTSHGARPEILALTQFPGAVAMAPNMEASPTSGANPKVRPAIFETNASSVNPTQGAIPGWRLWQGPTGVGATDSRVAYYQQGKEIVELTLIRAPSLQPPLRHPLQVIASGERVVASPQGTVHIQPHESLRFGRDCLFFDYTPKGADWRIFTTNSYVPRLPHTVSWYATPYVETVGADTAQARDSFVQAYLAAQQR